MRGKAATDFRFVDLEKNKKGEQKRKLQSLTACRVMHFLDNPNYSCCE